MDDTLRRICLSIVVIAISLAAAPDASAHGIEREQQCLALAIYWEARGEDERGMTAVGWTVLNRVYHPEFPATPCEVVFQGGETAPCQFSWYCDGKSDRPRNWHSWSHAMLLAARLLTDPPGDPTGGALYYHSRHIVSRWHLTRPRLTRIGGHVFYR